MWLYIVHYLSAADIAKQLCISEKTVKRCISSYETTGDAEPQTYTHGPPKLLGDFEQLVLLKIITHAAHVPPSMRLQRMRVNLKTQE